MEACPTCKYLEKDGVRCALVNEKRFPFPLDAPCRPQMLREQEGARQGLAECLAAKAVKNAVKEAGQTSLDPDVAKFINYNFWGLI